jgi:hypothetical protein
MAKKRAATLKEILNHPTADVPDVGAICFGLSRNASYEAAKKGQIPVIEVGRLKKVPTSWVRRTLQIEDEPK